MACLAVKEMIISMAVKGMIKFLVERETIIYLAISATMFWKVVPVMTRYLEEAVVMYLRYIKMH